MYADVNGFLPTLDDDDFRFDLSIISSCEQHVEGGCAVDAYQSSEISRYCLHKAPDDHFYLPLAKKT